LPEEHQEIDRQAKEEVELLIAYFWLSLIHYISIGAFHNYGRLPSSKEK